MGPLLFAIAGLALAGLAVPVARRLIRLRHRLATMQSDIVNIQNAVGLSPVRSAPASVEAELRERVEFLVNQVAELKAKLRMKEIALEATEAGERAQTRASFDWQWKHLAGGDHLPSDPAFMASVKEQICAMTQLPAAWFEGKSVADVGCGLGRFTFGLLSLGARVTAVDQSAAGLGRVKELCAQFGERLTTHQANILNDTIPGTYDLTWSFGVVHHTGSTYRAIQTVTRAVKSGGKLFLMIYGYPTATDEFVQQNNYDRIRRTVRNMTFEDKVTYLQKHFDATQVHGWFDAVSPRINDILTFEEVEDLLLALGLSDVRQTVRHANLHLMADRR